MSFAPAELSCDAFLDGRLRLWQPRRGYRAATDPVLLAAFVPARPGERVLELGCGGGTAALCLGRRVPGLELHGLELQPAYAELARLNAAENGLALAVHEGDLRRPPAALRRLVFDHVLANPPFHPPPATGADDPGRDRAHREGEAGLADWIAAGLAAARARRAAGADPPERTAGGDPRRRSPGAPGRSSCCRSPRAPAAPPPACWCAPARGPARP